MNKPTSSEVAEITGTEIVPLTYELRYRVWSKEASLVDSIQEMGVICDEHDTHARHWAAFSCQGTLVASARLCVHEKWQDVPEGDCYKELELTGPIASINRLIVEPSARNCGIAKKLDLQRIEAAKEAGASCIVAAPTSDLRILALKRLGFLSTPYRCKCTYKKDFWLSVMVMELRSAG